MADESKQTAKSTGDASSSDPEVAGTDLGEQGVSDTVSKPEATKPIV